MKNILKVILVFNSLFFFNFQTSFSQDTKFQFRGAPQDSKAVDAILKINPDLLISISEVKTLSNDLDATNVFLKKISKTLKPTE